MAYNNMSDFEGVDPFRPKYKLAQSGPFSFGQSLRSANPQAPPQGEFARTTPIAANSSPFGFSPYAGLNAQHSAADVDANGHSREGFIDPSQYLDQGALAKLGWTGGNGTDPNQSGVAQGNAPSLQNNPDFTNFLTQNKYSLGGGMLPGDEKSTGYLTDPSGQHLAQNTYDGSDGGLFMGLAAAGLGGFGLQAAGLGAGSAVGGESGAGLFNAAADSQAASTQLGISGADAAASAGGSIPNSVNLANAGGSFSTGVGGYAEASPFTQATIADQPNFSLENAGAPSGPPGPEPLANTDPVFNAAKDSQLASANAAYDPASMGAGAVGAAVPAALSSSGLQNLGNALSGVAAPVSQFLKDNPTLGRFADAAAAAGGAGLASKFLSGNAPPTVNAGQVMQQQGAANLTAAQQQAQINRVDTTTPFGFQKFGQVADPSLPGGIRYTQDIGFSPEQKKLYDSETNNQLASQGIASSLQGRVAQSVANPLDLSSAGAMEKALPANQFSADRDKVSSALFDRLTSLRKPQMDRDRSALDVQLRNQGLMPGTEAYNNSMRTMMETQGSELSNAANQAIAAGGAEQSRLQGDSRANSSLNNNVRSQSIQEKLLERQQPLAEYNSFRTGNTPTLPAFQPFGMGTVAPANTLAASNSQYQTEADAYNARIAKLQSLLNFGVTASKP